MRTAVAINAVIVNCLLAKIVTQVGGQIMDPADSTGMEGLDAVLHAQMVLWKVCSFTSAVFLPAHTHIRSVKAGPTDTHVHVHADPPKLIHTHMHADIHKAHTRAQV